MCLPFRLWVLWFVGAFVAAAGGPLAFPAFAAGPNDGRPSVGLLVNYRPGQRIDVETELACDLAREWLRAKVIFAAPAGTFVDAQGRPVAGDELRVIWCYGSEPSQPPGALQETATLDALKQWTSRGGGLLLSGFSAPLAGPLGLDKVRAEPATFGHDRAQSGLVPVRKTHPAFRGADLDRGVLWFSNAAFPAYAELAPALPAGACLLARTPGGSANPLVEYASGQGRVVLLAWRFGRLYEKAPAEYRDNLRRLVTNLVDYLARREAWLDMAGGKNPPPEPPDPLVPAHDWESLELAIRDLVQSCGPQYPRGAEYLERLAALKREHDQALTQGAAKPLPAKLASDLSDRFEQLRSEALLANPLLDPASPAGRFDRLLLVKRSQANLGLPANYLSNSSLPPKGYDNEIALLSPVRPGGKLTTLYRPADGRFVGDVDLHFDADRLLFSMPGANGRWQVHEIRPDGSGLTELELIRQADVDNYDACYLPSGGVAFCSTACFTGVPCINGSGHVCNLYVRRPDGQVRQLTVEQDHDWCPTVLNNGKLLYLRWEYTDIPHAFSRILFHMNPDGTEQLEYYGSNSYWPASMFFARPVPGHPTQVAAIVGGHHELPRMGDLVIFDPSRGRLEAEGAVQRIPGRGRKVVPTLLDLPIAQTWPKFLHPCPLSEKQFLVSCQPGPGRPWGIYLADVFDNLVLICEQSGFAMLEPIPLRKTTRPPVIPDKTVPARQDAEVSIVDIYRGPGLAGVERGTIKSLRVIGYQFAYQGMGAEPYSIGLDGPWDPKIVLGTAGVHEDGSARFRVPACTPIALQPLDGDGQAVQLMRSWMTAMPGEVLSCVGCHEPQGASPPVRQTLASVRPPEEIRPWHGPPRGFSFRREVQPVLDKYCVGCHDGRGRADGRTIPCLLDGPPVPTIKNTNSYNLASKFSPSYYHLRRLVRTPTKESDLHLLRPWEFHASTTRLMQMLGKGHHGVRLDGEARDRLATWIDLNAPFYGSWTEVRGGEIGPVVRKQWERRREMRKRYAGINDDFEADCPPASLGKPVAPAPAPAVAAPLKVACPGWPFGPDEAQRRQRGDLRQNVSCTVKLADGVTLELVRIPAGALVMGQADGCDDERPLARQEVAQAFWMGRFEITNEQFAMFDPAHDSGIEYGDYIQFSPGERGWSLSRPRQPVVRVSWHQAMAFCRWLSQRTHLPLTLPTELQWEYACRAGSGGPLAYGGLDSDFSNDANLADASLAAIDPFGWSGRTQVLPAWRPADVRFNDGRRVSAGVGDYLPNAWGLHDMHGNAAEWTRSAYRPYPYRDDDGRNDRGTGIPVRGPKGLPVRPTGVPPVVQGRDGPATHSAGRCAGRDAHATPDRPDMRVVRGGSWYDPPQRCRSAFRQAYRPEQGVFDVGFRVVCDRPDLPPRVSRP